MGVITSPHESLFLVSATWLSIIKVSENTRLDKKRKIHVMINMMSNLYKNFSILQLYRIHWWTLVVFLVASLERRIIFLLDKVTGSYSVTGPKVTYNCTFNSGTSGEESACQCRRHKRQPLSPWVGKIPWRRKWQPTPVFLPRKIHGLRSLAGYSPWGHKESDTTERAEHTQTFKVRLDLWE